MAVQGYKGHYISVFLTPDKSGNSSCVPFVEIRHNGDQGPLARLMLEEAFESAVEASAYGFKVGKQWVDERNAKTEAGGVCGDDSTSSLKPGLGFKSWLTSLF
jgi:hypothetical protein